MLRRPRDGRLMVAVPQMSEGTPPDPLRQLGQRLDRAQRERAAETRHADAPPPGGLGFGFRIGIELVAALCVGLALGWVFDHFVGTRPWGLIVGFFLGVAAGMLNVFREAKGLIFGPPPPGGDRREGRLE
jgi:ATP synthase protein I